jgi:hypothetical protein
MRWYTLKDGKIDQSGNFKFAGDALETDKNIVRGWDGILYFEDEVPVMPLDEAKSRKRAEITAARNAAIDNGGAEFKGLHFWTDKGSKSDILFAVAAAQMGTLTAAWKAKDGILPIADISDLTGIAEAVGLFVEAQYAIEFGLLAQIDAAGTVEEVEAVTWPGVPA